MQIVINNIKMPIGHTTSQVIETAHKIVRSACISADGLKIYRRSLDARRKNNIHYVYSVTAEVPEGTVLTGDIKPFAKTEELEIPKKSLKSRPVVVGMGPCGLFSAWVLTMSGNPPLIIERGGDVDSRSEAVKSFWQTGVLDKNSNVQFGEGGAGTFSDGKLNTRISDTRQYYVLKTLAEAGAPEEILYNAKPHIGTDLLRNVIKNMRNKMIELGAEIRFNTCVTDIKVKGSRLVGIEVNNDEYIPCDKLVLAIGHSSRDTYENLFKNNIELAPKAFAMGVRIEHSQDFINRLQYGDTEGLPSADYRVVYNGRDRSCYSFCMCPGGVVVNASSEENMLAVNGMSYHKRDGANANSALVVNVGGGDFGNSVLGGMELQRRYESIAYDLGQGKAPVQKAEDLVKDRPAKELGSVMPTVMGGYSIAEIKKCLPDYVTETLKEGLADFESRMKGFVTNDAVLTGIESRTSAPVRILRDNTTMESVSVRGLYPSGEGAGYAGGIVSASVDGIRSAIAMIEKGQ